MTPDEQKLLQQTAEKVLVLFGRLDDIVTGTQIFLAELYRTAQFSPEQRSVLLSRLRIHRDILRTKNQPTTYLDKIISDLSGETP